MPRYVALLRGINVGGKNLIRMPALKACFEEHGFASVATYIQSGNVLFASSETSGAKLTRRIEAMLTETFRYPASVVVRSRSQMRAVVDGAPEGFGTQPGSYLYDVYFLKAPVSARVAIREIPTHPEVDRIDAGPGVLYSRRLASRATTSRLNRVASLPIYQRMTIRNWNTTVKLRALLDASGGVRR